MKRIGIICAILALAAVAQADNTATFSFTGSVTVAGDPQISDLTGSTLTVNAVYGEARTEDIASTATFTVTGQAGGDALPGHFEYANSTAMADYRFNRVFISPVRQGTSPSEGEVSISSTFDYQVLGDNPIYFTTTPTTYCVRFGVPSAATTQSIGDVSGSINLRVVYN